LIKEKTKRLPVGIKKQRLVKEEKHMRVEEKPRRE